MTLVQVKDWLKTFNLFDYYYIAKINGAKPKVLGIYSNPSGGPPVHAIGQPSSYEKNGIRLLIHGTKDAEETQALATALFNALTDVVGVQAGDFLIHYVDLRMQEPFSLGMDTNGFYEYTLNIDIYSRRY